MWSTMRASVRPNDNARRHVLVEHRRDTRPKPFILPRNRGVRHIPSCIWIRPGHRGDALAVKTPALTGRKRKMIFHCFAQSCSISRWSGRLLRSVSTSRRENHNRVSVLSDRLGPSINNFARQIHSKTQLNSPAHLSQNHHRVGQAQRHTNEPSRAAP